jgi:hypothetical protein
MNSVRKSGVNATEHFSLISEKRGTARPNCIQAKIAGASIEVGIRRLFYGWLSASPACDFLQPLGCAAQIVFSLTMFGNVPSKHDSADGFAVLVTQIAQVPGNAARVAVAGSYMSFKTVEALAFLYNAANMTYNAVFFGSIR